MTVQNLGFQWADVGPVLHAFANGHSYSLCGRAKRRRGPRDVRGAICHGCSRSIRDYPAVYRAARRLFHS